MKDHQTPGLADGYLFFLTFIYFTSLREQDEAYAEAYADGYDLEIGNLLEVASMMVTWWIVACLDNVVYCKCV